MNTFIELAAQGVRQLQPYQPGKPIEELERELGIRDAVKLASNENPLGPSARALEAAGAVLKDIWLYPDGGGFALKARLAAHLGVTAEMLTLGNGSSDVLEFAMRAFSSPRTEVVFSEHSFAIYPILAKTAGTNIVSVPAQNWGNDLTALRQAITEDTRLVFIANPNNPTGTWLEGVALEGFISDLPPHVMVVVDEAYFEYASYTGTGASGYPDTVAWVERYPNLIVTRTFSKCYGLAGLRVGYSVSHPQVADLLNRVRPPFNVNSLALVAAEAALGDHEHLARSLQMNAEGLTQLRQAFTETGLDYIPSAGNFISVDVGREAQPVYDALLRKGVIVRPVANYGMPRHLRVTVGTTHQNQRFIDALKQALA